MFCAVHVPRPARELVLQHIESLRRALPQAKASWARDANIHLTLKFSATFLKLQLQVSRTPRRAPPHPSRLFQFNSNAPESFQTNVSRACYGLELLTLPEGLPNYIKT